MKGVAEPVRAYIPVRALDSPSSSGIIKMTENHELVFPNRIVNTKNLSYDEKRTILFNIKEVFNALKGDLKNPE